MNINPPNLGTPSKDGLCTAVEDAGELQDFPSDVGIRDDHFRQVHIGMGDKLDDQKRIELRSGGFGEAPAQRS